MRSAIAAEHPSFDLESIGAGAWERLDRLALASPLYAQLLKGDPSLCLWLEEERNLRTAYRAQALIDEWNRFSEATGDPGDDEQRLGLLRRWRRRMSLRIAYRSVNAFADESVTVGELSRLAEFCIRACLALAARRTTERLGEPWDEDAGRRARFCVLAMGKLGGSELNFSSDVDLVYFYEGDGHCRREGKATDTYNSEYFGLMTDALTRMLNARTGDGFLFRVDARLRPEGAWGPLVHSIAALENYYATGGQTWERLALIKARPVAGDLDLGDELLEDLHGFRYPRRPPPSLLGEIAAMKQRTEREIVGAAALDRDVKRGPGGIREIEFVAQSLQLLHAGRYPFLQTHATAAALEQLARYRLVDPPEAASLVEAYWFLRQTEHRLQMRDEAQTHELPSDPAELGAVAASLGFPSPAAFREALDLRRAIVRAVYSALFADRRVDPAAEAWWEFLTTDRIPPPIAEDIARWFGGAPEAAEALRRFACGDRRATLTAELVTRFRHLAEGMDGFMPELARPLETLNRLERFAERYGTRRQFLESCASNPQFLRVLALLCDRSSFAVELLCAHPEIFEEVLRPENLSRRKTPRDMALELERGLGPPPGPGEDLSPAQRSWLWLYLRAEQMRYVIGELLGLWSVPEMEASMVQLADAAIARLCDGSGLLVVALGKCGGGELTFGSDLDLLFVGSDGPTPSEIAAAERLRACLHAGNPVGPAFAVDLRLRPHGDAGPLVVGFQSLRDYHARGGPAASAGGEPGAQTWEKQALVRARTVSGPPALAGAFERWRDQLLFGAPLAPAEEADIWAMLGRIERERAPVHPPERTVKTGPGSLVDIEFHAQVLQLRHGHADPRLRVPGTRAALRALAASGIMDAGESEYFIGHYDFLKRIELALQRDANASVRVLPAQESERAVLARWLGFPDGPAFWSEHVRLLHETRDRVRRLAGANARLLP